MYNNKNKNKVSYLQTNESKIINENQIRWVKKINECLEVCTKSTGCDTYDTHKICKSNNQDSYNKLNQFFK